MGVADVEQLLISVAHTKLLIQLFTLFLPADKPRTHLACVCCVWCVCLVPGNCCSSPEGPRQIPPTPEGGTATVKMGNGWDDGRQPGGGSWLLWT